MSAVPDRVRGEDASGAADRGSGGRAAGVVRQGGEQRPVAGEVGGDVLADDAFALSRREGFELDLGDAGLVAVAAPGVVLGFGWLGVGVVAELLELCVDLL